MRLKKLTLHGFKTFADRTEIAFSEGVTAVVGPNGSGKSNIADAVLWVLGEQKASALRGATARDVIFSGSQKRRPMGMAEVSLTVDNSDGVLPIAFDEVTVTRRAYRTGEGEFFINKVPCRLKDIYELFLDTGVGRESYALVNQSEIDAVLSANPEDRRGLFEEAAGIKKYRVKKREALRKLDATEANLHRVRDILGEIEGRLEPLRDEAERAAQYVRVRNRLREIETNLLIVELRAVDGELTNVRAQRDDDATLSEQAAEALAEAETTLGETEAGLQLAEAALDECRASLQEALAVAERSESRRALADQRAHSLEGTIEILTGELASLGQRRAEIAGRIEALRAERQDRDGSDRELQTQASEKDAVVRSLAEQIQALSRQAERRRAESLGLARQHAARQADLARAEARYAALEADLPALRDQSAQLSQSAAARVAEEAEARDAAEKARAAATAVAAQLDAARSAYDEARHLLNERRGALSTAESRCMSIDARLRALRELEQAQEGYYAGVKAVIAAARKGALPGSYTVVADAFVAPAGLETALETALGSSLQDIITETEDEAKAAIGLLYEQKLGRATFLPLARMRPSRDALDIGRAKGQSGVIGGAMDVIQYDRRFKPALDVLLGRVLLCETLDDATRAAPLAHGWSRIVTRTGEVVSPSGAMTGGRQAGRGAGQILGRKTEIASLDVELAAAAKSQDGAAAGLNSAEEDRKNTESALSDAQSARQQAELQRGEAERSVQFAVAEARRSTEAAATAVQKAAASTAALAEAREQIAVASSALADAGEQTADADTALSSEAEQLRVLTAQRDAALADVTGVRVALAGAVEKVAGVDRALRDAQDELARLVEQADRQDRQCREARAEYDDLRAHAVDRDREAAAAVAAREAILSQLETRQTARQEAAAATAAAMQALRRIEEERSGRLEIIHKLDLRQTRLEMQHAQLSTRLVDEYELDPDDAIALPEDPVVTDGSPQEVWRLRRELRSMGDVNVGAIDEYAEIAERYEFLTAQRADLEEAREKLMAAIKDIDESTRGVFLETFAAVSKAFQEIFSRLFNGGETELVLTSPDDLLETGIDIVAQPPGKKRQNLALLSGGERALTATALLFAFLRVRPSPFCVMDEVDAPLDGANVEKFADLLRDFGARSQFVIITHNPTTMEAAPIWYGITMHEPGVSRVLGMQAPDVAETPRVHHNGHNSQNGRNGQNGHHVEPVLLTAG